jgi:hypothetical protein
MVFLDIVTTRGRESGDAAKSKNSSRLADVSAVRHVRRSLRSMLNNVADLLIT